MRLKEPVTLEYDELLVVILTSDINEAYALDVAFDIANITWPETILLFANENDVAIPDKSALPNSMLKLPNDLAFEDVTDDNETSVDIAPCNELLASAYVVILVLVSRTAVIDDIAVAMPISEAL